MFAIGLFVIVSYEFNLFTGKIGYIFDNKLNYLIEVGITLTGNFIGTYLISLFLKHTRIENLIIFLCLSVFILSGFEHCIANMFYFSIASV